MRQSLQRYGKPGELWLLSQPDMEELDISYLTVLEVVEQALRSLRDGDSHNPPKTIVQPRDQRSIGYAMVGRDGASETLGFKMVYEFDQQRIRDAYRFHSFIFLCDDSTGAPIALMDVVRLGPLRTSATSALMARAAAPGARSALVVGSGVQGQMALPMLLAAMPNLEHLMVHGRHADGLAAVQARVAEQYPGRTVEIVHDLRQAAGLADVIIGAAGIGAGIGAGSSVRRDWLKPGAVAVLLGYGIDADVLHGADYRIATDIEQMKVTCGDLAAADGTIPPVDAQLPDILLGKAPARRDARDVVFAYNSGMAVTDVALGRYLADLALAGEHGVRVRLW